MNKNMDYSAIQPPKLEDAGLEDPALPIEGIQEAFLRAANLARFNAHFNEEEEEEDDDDGTVINHSVSIEEPRQSGADVPDGIKIQHKDVTEDHKTVFTGDKLVKNNDPGLELGKGGSMNESSGSSKPLKQ